MDFDNIFWSASVEEMKKGYKFDKAKGQYVCIICAREFTKGIIYKSGENLCDAETAVKTHIKEKHNSMFDYFLNFNKKYSGLTDNQKELFSLFRKGLSDKEIVEMTSAGSPSTIRNSRFAIREKYKQAKITVVLTELMEEERDKARNSPKSGKAQIFSDDFINIHRSVTAFDERFAITVAEKDEILGSYFDENMKLKQKPLPRKEKRRIVIFQVIMGNFEKERNYTEKEVNNIIAEYYSDIETIRRFLIDYGFMDRSKDGSKYWVK